MNQNDVLERAIEQTGKRVCTVMRTYIMVDILADFFCREEHQLFTRRLRETSIRTLPSSKEMWSLKCHTKLREI